MANTSSAKKATRASARRAAGAGGRRVVSGVWLVAQSDDCERGDDV